MFVKQDPSDFIFAERVVGHLGNGAVRGRYGNAEQFVQWVAENGAEKPAFTNVGRWKRGQEGSFHAPLTVPWITIDLDGWDPIELHEDVMHFLRELDIRGYDMRRIIVSWSGKKGFHIQISSKQFGNPVFKNSDAATCFLRAYIDDLSDGVEWDNSVTSPQSLLRVAGSKHGDTEAYKRPWYAEVFKNMPVERILRNIRRRKSIKFYDESDKIVKGPRQHVAEVVPKAKNWLLKVENESDDSGHGVMNRIKGGLQESQEFGPKPFHVGRENGAYIIACWYLERYSEQMAWEKLKAWNNKNRPPLPRTRLRAQFRGGKRTIYERS